VRTVRIGARAAALEHGLPGSVPIPRRASLRSTIDIAMKNKILIGISLALLCAGAWWAMSGGTSSVVALTPDGSVGASSARSEAVLDGPAIAGALGADQDVKVREALAEDAPVLEAAADSWVGELGGVIGRVVEEDGSAVAGVSVAFIQVDANLMLGADWAELGEGSPELVLERTLTDAEGRFRMTGAYDGSFQGLGIDLRGPRCTIRVVDTQVHHREVTDLGDIIMVAGCTVIGRVTDEDGGPVAGVRVRIVPIAPDGVEAVIPVEVQDFRSDCAVGISAYIHDGSSSPVVEPPPLVRRHLDDLPIPTTISDVEGRYRFEGVPIGDIMLAIDLRGWLGMLRKDSTRPGEVELPDAILRAGRVISGEVIDTEGDPVAGAEVMAGAEIGGVAAILQPAGVTDLEGRFSVSGCPLLGNLVACARREKNEPWVGVVGAEVDDMEIELETVFNVVVHVLDLAGQPVAGAKVSLQPGFEAESPMLWMMRVRSLGAPERVSRFSEGETGVYTCRDVTPGMYEVRVRPSELSPVHRTEEVWPGMPPLTLVCQPGRFLDLSVFDRTTGEPVVHARASIVQPSNDLFRALAVGRTNSDGLLRLGPYVSGADDSGAGDGENQVLVQHPRYADAAIVVHESVPTAEVLLARGNELRGRIQWGPDPPRQIYMLILERRNLGNGGGDIAEAFLPPRFARTALDGSFRFTNLPSGTYQLQVHERWLGGDPLDLARGGLEPVLVYRQDDIAVEEGPALDLLIDLGIAGTGDTARVAGYVRFDGKPLADATVQASGMGSRGQATTDADGYYETTPFLVGESCNVRVWAMIDSQKRELHSGEITPTPGSVYRLDIDGDSVEIQVRVKGEEDGRPIAGANVSLHVNGSRSNRARGKTDASGELALTVFGSGTCEVKVEAPDRLETTHAFSLDDGDVGDPIEIVLARAVPCAGMADLSSIGFEGGQRVFMQVRGEGEISEGVRLDPADMDESGCMPFDIDGLGPGEYTARFYVENEWSRPVAFELPVAGDSELLLVHPGPE
jgi:hypothetical protein